MEEETITRVEVVARDNVAAGRGRGHFLHNALFVVKCRTQCGDAFLVFPIHNGWTQILILTTGSIVREGSVSWDGWTDLVRLAKVTVQVITYNTYSFFGCLICSSRSP